MIELRYKDTYAVETYWGISNGWRRDYGFEMNYNTENEDLAKAYAKRETRDNGGMPHRVIKFGPVTVIAEFSGSVDEDDKDE